MKRVKQDYRRCRKAYSAPFKPMSRDLLTYQRCLAFNLSFRPPSIENRFRLNATSDNAEESSE